MSRRSVREICARFPVPGLPPGDLRGPAVLPRAAVAAAVVAYFLTPLAMRFATAIGAIDEPDSGRRIHIRPIPRAGGLAVALSFVFVGIGLIA